MLSAGAKARALSATQYCSYGLPHRPFNLLCKSNKSTAMPSRDEQQLTFNFKSSELTLPCLSRQISRRPTLEGKLVPKKSQVSAKSEPGRGHKNALLTLTVLARAL